MQTPSPQSDRPSSVARQQAPREAEPVPARTGPVGDALPPPETDDTATVISLNRPRLPDQIIIDNLKGRKLGHFELIEPIGVGGMAAVIRALDLQLGRTVALKILPPDMAADPENIARFKSEARAAAKLDHENIARVFFCGEDQGLHFIAFEFVEGTDLRALFARQGRLTSTQAVRFMLQIATGLAHAAERGVIHRDIKPSNIIVTPEGRAKIVDMGLARHADVAGAVTQSGVTLGTFDYISPEQALEPRSADVRSDIYSLGCTFYHLLTGTPPVPEGTAAKKLHHHQQIDPVDPRELNPSIPDELTAILARMMAKDPRHRYQRPEHLVQHLIQVAQKLQMGSDGSGAETVLFMDAPLPRPPRFSPWVAAALAASAVAVIAAVLGFLSSTRDPNGLTLPWSNQDEGPRPPPWLAGPTTETPGPDGRPDPTPAVEPRTAATIQELAKLIEQRAEYIRLTGNNYELSDLFVNEPAKAPGFQVSSRRLRIEGAAGNRPPVLRWSGAPSGGRAVDSVAAFQIVAADADAQVEFVNVRFECHSAEDDPPTFAVSARHLAQLSFRKCEFFHDRHADSATGGIIRMMERDDQPTLLTLDECLFYRGPNAVDLTDRCQLRVSQCAFGPHEVLFRLRPAAARVTPNPSFEIAEFRHCTVMMRSGSIFQLEKGTSGTVRAGWCLFGRTADANDADDAVLLRQKDAADEFVFAGLAGAAASRNVYHNVVFWEAGGTRASRASDARKHFGFSDGGAIELTQRPWRNPEPFRLVDDRPQDAFALVTTLAALRTQPRSVRMLGVQRGTWGETYADPLKPLADDPVEPFVIKRLVNPAWAAETPLPPYTYRTLESALSEAKPGDAVLLQINGPVDLQPVRWSRSDDRPLLLRPDDGYKPVLVLHSDVAEPVTALFTITGGRIDFRDLRFRLQADPKKERDRLSVVALMGAGHATFTHCAFTLEEGEGCANSVVHLTGDGDAANRATERRPRIRFDACFVRGKGNLLDVRPSRRFELEAENTLVALDGSLISIHAHPKEVPPLAGTVTLHKVTAYTNDYVLDLRLAEEERKSGGGLAATFCKVENCLLVAGNAKAFVHAFGIDSDALQKQYLTWEGRGNVYANFVQMIEVELPATAMMMPTMPVSPKAWRSFTREGEDSFVDVKLIRPPTADRPLARMVPDDFRVKPLDMKKMEAPSDTGAKLGDLPVVEE